MDSKDFPQLSGTLKQILWFLGGIACGMLAWHWSTASWIVTLLKLVCGFGVISQGLLLGVLVAFIAGNVKWRFQQWAIAEFESRSPRACRSLHRGGLVLLGLGTVAVVAWLRDQDTGAAITATGSAILSALFLHYATLLRQLHAGLSSGSQQTSAT